MYVNVCGHNAEQCYCMSECYRMTMHYCSTTLNKMYGYVRTCTEVRIQWQTIRQGQGKHAGQDKDVKGQGWLYWTTVACAANGAV